MENNIVMMLQSRNILLNYLQKHIQLRHPNYSEATQVIKCTLPKSGMGKKKGDDTRYRRFLGGEIKERD